MTPDELRAAAVSVAYATPADWVEPIRCESLRADAVAVASRLLADYPADDREPVTVERLPGAGFEEIGTRNRRWHREGELPDTDGWFVALERYDHMESGPYWVLTGYGPGGSISRGLPKTWGDVRRAFAFLGVPVRP